MGTTSTRVAPRTWQRGRLCSVFDEPALAILKYENRYMDFYAVFQVTVGSITTSALELIIKNEPSGRGRLRSSPEHEALIDCVQLELEKRTERNATY